ncbi:unnamed protein product, partial [Allacma fusca]
MAAPTHEELLLINQLRVGVSDLKLPDDSDMFFVRWIRARENNLNQAEGMLRKHIQYRKDHGWETILTWEPPLEFQEEFPAEVLGKDPENVTVGGIAYGKWPLKKCYENGMKDIYMRYIEKVTLEAAECSMTQMRPDGVPITQVIAIYDMAGLSMKNFASLGTVNMILEGLRSFEENFPETLKAAYVINASRIFSLLFNLIKPILSQRTFGKVYVFDSNDTKWKPVLRQIVSEDRLPVAWGGKNVDSVLNVKFKD